MAHSSGYKQDKSKSATQNACGDDGLAVPLHPVYQFKGRGANLHIAHRFSKDEREVYDDGWQHAESEDEQLAPPVTTVRYEQSKSAIFYNDSPDIPFDRSINPYRGCEHGCIYCYARPYHAYLDLSPGLDFETQIIARSNIAELFRKELARPKYAENVQPIALGSMTDCYQPIERKLKLTRQIIEVLHETQHPFFLITRGSAVERDLDLIASMAKNKLAQVCVTITTLDRHLARILEPRAPTPQRRLQTVAALAQAGVPVSVSIAPQIPFLNDDMEQVIQAAAQAGATSAFYTILRLSWELKPLFESWLQQHYSERAQRIMARIRDLRGGKTNDSRFGVRMHAEGIWADLIRQRFYKALRQHGMNLTSAGLDTTRFQHPVWVRKTAQIPSRHDVFQPDLFE